MNSLRTKIPLAAAVLLAGAALSVALLTPSDAAAGGKTSEALRAIATARAASAHGVAYDVESERRGGTATWEVKVGTGGGRAVEYTISANGRKVVSHRALAHDTEAGWAASTKVGLARALRIADATAAGAFDEAELDRERGRLIWSATFGDGGGEAEVEVEVDATSGRVVGHGSD